MDVHTIYLDAILRSAAAVDPEAAALREDIQLRQRREAMRTVVDWVAARGPLRGGMDADVTKGPRDARHCVGVVDAALHQMAGRRPQCRAAPGPGIITVGR